MVQRDELGRWTDWIGSCCCKFITCLNAPDQTWQPITVLMSSWTLALQQTRTDNLSTIRHMTALWRSMRGILYLLFCLDSTWSTTFKVDGTLFLQCWNWKCSANVPVQDQSSTELVSSIEWNPFNSLDRSKSYNETNICSAIKNKLLATCAEAHISPASATSMQIPLGLSGTSQVEKLHIIFQPWT